MSHTWIPSSTYAGLPPNAVYAGNDSDGSPIYVGRAHFSGDQLPAKVIPSKNYASVAYNGAEHSVGNYEVLCGDGFTWVASSNGHVPEGAVTAGTQSNGETLYVGRGHYKGSITPGKIHQAHGCLYIGHSHREVSIKQYEVLVGMAKCNWVASAIHSPPPPGAILVGNDTDGSPIFVGRAYHEGETIPAKVIPSKNAAYVPYGGQEIFKHQFEILCNGNTNWIPSGHGQVPHNAVPGGNAANGEPLYIGRVHHMGTMTPGKIHPSHGSMYIPFGGQEIPFKNYEVLVEN